MGYAGPCPLIGAHVTRCARACRALSCAETNISHQRAQARNRASLRITSAYLSCAGSVTLLGAHFPVAPGHCLGSRVSRSV